MSYPQTYILGLDRKFQFPRDVALFRNHVARGWTVQSDLLLMEALRVINEKLDRILGEPHP